MEAGLFNPGFIGNTFHWWIGQIADDSSWRINTSEKQFREPEEGVDGETVGIPGWGYRYKVRIIGQHDQDEDIVPSDQLPWAQVMYPVTAGGGQGASFQTPGLKQGNFVFGFYMDGQDQQVPVIMGVLGNNAKTKLEMKTGAFGGTNFGPQSFYAKKVFDEPNEQKKLKKSNVAAPKDKVLDPKKNISRESTDATHQRTQADEEKKVILERKHALACPDPDHQSDIKNIQTCVENLTEKTQQAQQSMRTFDKAGSFPIHKIEKNIDKEITASSEEIAKYMKGVMGQFQQYTTKEFNEKSMPMLNLAVPSFKNKLMEDQIAGLEKLACTFNAINGGLAGLIAAALMNAFKRKKKQSQKAAENAAKSAAGVAGVTPEEVIEPTNELDTPGSEVLPSLPPDGYYTPTPLCSTEELVGEILGQNISTIMNAFDSAIGPMVETTKQSLGDTGNTEAGEEPIGSIENSVNENNVLAAVASGALIGAVSSSMADASGVNPNFIGPVTSMFITGDYAAGLDNLMDLAGVKLPKNSMAISNALTSIKNGDIAGGFSAVAGVLDVDPLLMSGAGAAFAAITSGDINGLIGSVGSLASGYPNILKSIIGDGAGLAASASDLLGGGLGALGGMNFDMATAMGFVKTITKTYDCDPKPKCSPNDIHTMQGGGSEADQPSTAGAAKAATEVANKTGTNRSFGSSIEKVNQIKEGITIPKKFKLPASRLTDLNSDIA